MTDSESSSTHVPHPFSIQPDMNKLELEMRQGFAVLRRAEASYED